MFYKQYLADCRSDYKNVCFTAFWVAYRLEKFDHARLRISSSFDVQWGLLNPGSESQESACRETIE